MEKIKSTIEPLTDSDVYVPEGLTDEERANVTVVSKKYSNLLSI
jgi:hypothetical protein